MFTLRQIFIATTLIALTLTFQINGIRAVPGWFTVAYHNAELDGEIEAWYVITISFTIIYPSLILLFTALIDTVIDEF